MIVRELITRLGFKVDEKGIKGAETSIAKFQKGIKIAALATGAAVLAIGAAAIKTAADFEMLETQFEVMLGSTEKAKSLMDELKKFAAATPFALGDLAKGSQQLLAFGVAEENVVETMRMLGDTAGGNAEKLSALVLAYGKVQTKGRVSMEEINMIAERGVPVIGTLTKQLGVTEEQFFKLISAGKIGRDHITQAFQTMTSEGGVFFEGMKKQSMTFSGMLSTLKDNFTLAAAGIGEKLLPTIKALMTTVNQLLEGALGNLIKELAGALQPIIEALNPVITMLSSALLKLAEPITKLVTVIAGFISEAVGPFSTILMVVIDLVSSLVSSLIDKLAPVFDVVQMVLKILANVMEKLSPALSVIFELLADLVGVILEIAATGLMDLFEPLGDILAEIAIILSDVLVAINPLLKAFTRMVAMGLGMQVKMWIFPFRIMLTVLSKILPMIRLLISLIMDFLTPAFEFMGAVFTKIFDTILNVFQTVLDKIIQGINFLFSWINKIPGIKIELPQISADALSNAMGTATTNNNSRVNNINMQNKFDISMGGAGIGDGMTSGSIKDTMSQAAHAAFSLELKRILITAM